MPSKPPTQRRAGQRPASPASITVKPHKLTTTERGYGWLWQQRRLRVLTDEPLCRICLAEGRVTEATEVDHIDGDSSNNDDDNLRPLCRACHLARTARDQAFGNMQWRPEWLRPSAIPLTIVCGPPASGKTTFVEQHAGKQDLVIDLDVIASAASGQSLHTWDRSRWLVPAIRTRNEMLGDIGRPSRRWPAAWLILSEAKAEHRQWWRDRLRPTRIVVLETMHDVCNTRARADDSRDAERTLAAITQWWSAYSRRVGDEIVRQP